MSETPESSPRSRFASVVMRLAKELSEEAGGMLPPGEIASLRREDGGRSPTFYKIAALLLGEQLAHHRSESQLAEAERRWARVTHLLAMTAGQHRGGASHLGSALAEAGVSEPRVLRLLRAEGDQIDGAARAALAMLAQRAVTFDPLDLAALVLTAPHPTARFHHEDGEDVRRRIARDFYRAVHRSESAT